MSQYDDMIIKRFLEMQGYSTGLEVQFNWSDGVSMTIGDIQRFLAEHQELQSQSGVCDEEILKRNLGGEWHCGRVKWFMEDPSRITPILIETQVINGVLSITPFIDDGAHRFAAAVLMGWDTIPSSMGGVVKTLNYLCGKRKKMPVCL